MRRLVFLLLLWPAAVHAADEPKTPAQIQRAYDRAIESLDRQYQAEQDRIEGLYRARLAELRATLERELKAAGGEVPRNATEIVKEFHADLEAAANKKTPVAIRQAVDDLHAKWGRFRPVPVTALVRIGNVIEDDGGNVFAVSSAVWSGSLRSGGTGIGRPDYTARIPLQLSRADAATLTTNDLIRVTGTLRYRSAARWSDDPYIALAVDIRFDETTYLMLYIDRPKFEVVKANQR